ncbi:G2/mitotic-specific cyclin-B-like [Amblyomma americanum]
MDHYIQECIIAKHKIDLLWKASLFVAAKLEERQNTKWRLDFINYINRVQGTKKAELFDMERDILLTLNWNLSWPLALNFLRRNCKAAQASREEELTAKFILEVCLVDYRMAWVAPSKQAAAALYCTFQLLGRTHHWFQAGSTGRLSSSVLGCF